MKTISVTYLHEMAIGSFPIHMTFLEVANQLDADAKNLNISITSLAIDYSNFTFRAAIQWN